MRFSGRTWRPFYERDSCIIELTDTLALAGKGYTADDILEQCQKLDEAGIEYYFVYMTGLAGKGGGMRNAENSARLFSRLNPYFISVDALTLFPKTELYERAGLKSLG